MDAHCAWYYAGLLHDHRNARRSDYLLCDHTGEYAMKKLLELVYVTWIDSECEIGWESADAVLKPFEVNHSVGFLIAQDEEKYVLVGDFDPETRHHNRFIRIPKVCVKKFRLVTYLPYVASVDQQDDA